VAMVSVSVSVTVTCGKVAKNLSDWFLESMSAALLATPTIWVVVM